MSCSAVLHVLAWKDIQTSHPIQPDRLSFLALLILKISYNRTFSLHDKIQSYSDEPTLKKLWNERNQLSITTESLLALIISECANGDISKHAWGTLPNKLMLLDCLTFFLVNCFYIFIRIEESGVKQEPLIKAGSYLILCCIDRFGSSLVTQILSNWNMFDERELPQEIKNYILEPVLNLLKAELSDVCTDNCARVYTDAEVLDKNEIRHYWNRLYEREDCEEDKKTYKLVTEELDKPCNVGICVDENTYCPFTNNDDLTKNIAQYIMNFEKVIKHRKQFYENQSLGKL